MTKLQNTDEIAGLVERCRAGEPDAFGRLVTLVHPTVFAICLARLGHGDDAEDVAQDVFLRAWLELPRLRDGRRFVPWVATMARRLCINAGMAQARRRRVLTVLPAETVARLPVPSRAASPAQVASQREEQQQTEAALALLAPAERELLALHFDEGLPLAEIGRLAGVETSTISRRMEKVLARLRVRAGVSTPAPRPSARANRAEATRRAAALATAFALLPPAVLAPLPPLLGSLAVVPSPTSIGVLLMKSKKVFLAAAAALLVGAVSTAVVLTPPSGTSQPAGRPSGTTAEALKGPVVLAPYRMGSVLAVDLATGSTVRIPHTANGWGIQDLEFHLRPDGGIDFRRSYVGSEDVEAYTWPAPLPTDLQLFYNQRPDADVLIMQAYLIEPTATGGVRVRYEAQTSTELKKAWDALELSYTEGRARRDAVDAGLRELRMRLFPTDPKMLGLARKMYGLP